MQRKKGGERIRRSVMWWSMYIRYGKHGRIINGCERRSCPQECGEKIKGQYGDGEESCLKR